MQECSHSNGKQACSSSDENGSSRFITSTKLSLLFSTLAGSCCWIQIALNLFGFGCTGFSALNPYRALFTVPALMTLFFAVFGQKTGLSAFRKLTLTAVVALSLLGREIIQNHQYISSYPSSASPTTIYRESFTFRATGLGCEACNSDVRARVLSLPGVVSVEYTGLGDDAVFYVIASQYVSNSSLNQIVAERQSEIVILSRAFSRVPSENKSHRPFERIVHSCPFHIISDEDIASVAKRLLQEEGAWQVEVDVASSKIIAEGTPGLAAAIPREGLPKDFNCNRSTANIETIESELNRWRKKVSSDASNREL